jgi:hypothetical protein
VRAWSSPAGSAVTEGSPIAAGHRRGPSSGTSQAGCSTPGSNSAPPLGLALIGAIVLIGLTSGFVTTIQSDQRISAEISAQVGVAVEGGVAFVLADRIRAAAEKVGLDPATTAALVEDYSKAQLGSLKVALLTTALLAFDIHPGAPHDPTGRARKEKEDPELSPTPA